MTVGLCMLVRNEANTVEQAISQTLPIVDHVTVVDTGSNDDTIDIVRDMDLPNLDLYEREWRGFGPNRTELLELARGSADYQLMLDADHILHIGTPHQLFVDSYLIKVLDDGGRLPLLTRDSHPFRYEGVAHSYLASDTPTRSFPSDWLAIEGGPGASREKLERDRVALEQAFVDNPDDARTVHYLAQTYRDLDLIPQAIRFYRLRADMNGFAEETYWARYQLGCLLSEHISFAQGAQELLRAYTERPTRIEALRALGNAANAVANKTPLPDDILFVRPAAYAALTPRST
jgi:glycosyltransferase involved in cell wall biosynthesis